MKAFFQDKIIVNFDNGSIFRSIFGPESGKSEFMGHRFTAINVYTVKWRVISGPAITYRARDRTDFIEVDAVGIDDVQPVGEPGFDGGDYEDSIPF